MTGHLLEIAPLSTEHWVVRYAGDVTPLSQHRTLAEARAAAINHARQFGEPTILVHELDGDCHEEHVDPGLPASRPEDVKGAHVEPEGSGST
jgi:uncharacterized protein DUF2188